MLKKISSGIAAGILISMGGSVFLACENRYVGAILFSVALLCICIKGYALFTGKIGYVLDNHKKDDISLLLLCLLGNLIATVIFGYAIRYAVPSIADAAEAVCTSKLNQDILQTFIRAAMCGILVYISVDIFRENKTIVGILFCIPVFILSGFEHSIADMFYFAASGIVSFDAFVFIWTVIIGNSFGALILPALKKVK